VAGEIQDVYMASNNFKIAANAFKMASNACKMAEAPVQRKHIWHLHRYPYVKLSTTDAHLLPQIYGRWVTLAHLELIVRLKL
jgi:hypothetical protein